jgi:hypothetical protein
MTRIGRVVLDDIKIVELRAALSQGKLRNILLFLSIYQYVLDGYWSCMGLT